MNRVLAFAVAFLVSWSASAQVSRPAVIATPGGNDQDVQYNNAGSLSGSDDYKFDRTARQLTLRYSAGQPTFRLRSGATAINDYLGFYEFASNAGSRLAYVTAKMSSYTDQGQIELWAKTHGGGDSLLFTANPSVLTVLSDWAGVGSLTLSGLGNFVGGLEVTGGSYGGLGGNAGAYSNSTDGLVIAARNASGTEFALIDSRGSSIFDSPHVSSGATPSRWYGVPTFYSQMVINAGAVVSGGSYGALGGAGGFYSNSTDGLVLVGRSGSTTDLIFIDYKGSSVFDIPHTSMGYSPFQIYGDIILGGNRYTFPSSAPSVGQALTAASVSGSNATLTWSNATGSTGWQARVCNHMQAKNGISSDDVGCETEDFGDTVHWATSYGTTTPISSNNGGVVSLQAAELKRAGLLVKSGDAFSVYARVKYVAFASWSSSTGHYAGIQTTDGTTFGTGPTVFDQTYTANYGKIVAVGSSGTLNSGVDVSAGTSWLEIWLHYDGSTVTLEVTGASDQTMSTASFGFPGTPVYMHPALGTPNAGSGPQFYVDRFAISYKQAN
jgi:hypothetical protein